MRASAIILAGGFSQRFGGDKALAKLAGKPLITHVLDNLPRCIDDRIVVVNTENQKATLEKVIQGKTCIIMDRVNVQSPLAGAVTGFAAAKNTYSLLLPCDNPFVSADVATLLLELCIGRNAAIPRSPESLIEPLQAAYNAEAAAKAGETALAKGGVDMQSMIECLPNVRYVSTLVIRQIDPQLNTFFNINTLNDLRRAEAIIKRARGKSG